MDGGPAGVLSDQTPCHETGRAQSGPWTNSEMLAGLFLSPSALLTDGLALLCLREDTPQVLAQAGGQSSCGLPVCARAELVLSDVRVTDSRSEDRTLFGIFLLKKVIS